MARRDVMLPERYDKLLNERMQTHGVGRSEAVRMFMREAEMTGARLARFNLKRLVAILRLNVATIRINPGKAPDALRAIELAADEIDKLCDGA